MNVLETARLQLRRLTPDDAAFILELLNTPSWLEFIGDKGVRTLEDARNYILNGPVNSYEQHGYGLFLVTLKQTDTRIGVCGLIRRALLNDADIGFAFLPAYAGQGYAYEAASATMHYARTVLGLDRVVAITTANNQRSIRLLEKLGLRFTKMIPSTEEDKALMLFN